MKPAHKYNLPHWRRHPSLAKQLAIVAASCLLGYLIYSGAKFLLTADAQVREAETRLAQAENDRQELLNILNGTVQMTESGGGNLTWVSTVTRKLVKGETK